MITKQDLETLERLYTPLSKILLEHLRVDHKYDTTQQDPWSVINEQQGKRIQKLRNELATLRSANPFYDINQQQGKRIQVLVAANDLLESEVDELTSELDSLKSDYIELQEICLLHPLKGT